MPALTFLAVVGLVLVGLLFVADATLENGPPPIVTSERTGLPKPWRPDGLQMLTTTPAPAPDMTSQAVLSAQPKGRARRSGEDQRRCAHGASRSTAQEQAYQPVIRLPTEHQSVRQIFDQGAVGSSSSRRTAHPKNARGRHEGRPLFLWKDYQVINS
jgi:hypothetical protein